MMEEAKGFGRKRLIVPALIVIAGLLLIPFPTQLSPDFTVRFVDDLGNPIRGMVVQRTCTHYTYNSLGSVCPDDWDNPKRTDDDGNVSFTANYVWYGAASRAVRTVVSYALLIAHGSVGRSITLFPRAPAGIKSSGWVDIDPDNPQKEVVLQREIVSDER
ncbi:MAG: hypothetical protein LC113_13195 [Acidobacteria bacterium]|nr:hypothetical protein [Acidobacteriota bacterium]